MLITKGRDNAYLGDEQVWRSDFFSKVAIEQVRRSDSEEKKRPRREEREFGVRKLKLWSLESVKDKKSKRRRGDKGFSIKDIINNINVRLGFMVQSWKSFLFNSILKLWEILENLFLNYMKNLEKRREMTWLLMWLNESVATLNTMLQLLVIYI